MAKKIRSGTPRADGEKKANSDFTNSDIGFCSDDDRFKYTSLKDLLPPTSHRSRHLKEGVLRNISQTAHEIRISNRLVQKAAWLYLRASLPREHADHESTE
ncbi:hypothetical protein L484_016323 [Morus notabilis]|uniref:Uncharacterized protein n=1 Tax=Morus notabilis TaxID=981085 RepID=W9RHI3_9ROSA|nr:hypothetical protein L484_016323 [Morus notabilis]